MMSTVGRHILAAQPLRRGSVVMTRPVPQLKTLRKLSKYQNTIGVVDKCSLEQLSAFWDSADESKHARERGLNAHLAFLEKFYMKAAQRLGNAGKFTKKGISIGECKLFTVLHCLVAPFKYRSDRTLRTEQRASLRTERSDATVMIKPTVLEHFQGLSTFYNRFKSLEKTQDILQNGGRFPGPFKQYFIA
ncbi:unnamed protein product [Durusdinium trenchii]|uniref:Uncharacterized protein n=1 Tax=Durusdinium trenchii TaxID=1381693 RepID=A0ABP0HY92_9DINO